MKLRRIAERGKQCRDTSPSATQNNASNSPSHRSWKFYQTRVFDLTSQNSFYQPCNKKHVRTRKRISTPARRDRPELSPTAWPSREHDSTPTACARYAQEGGAG